MITTSIPSLSAHLSRVFIPVASLLAFASPFAQAEVKTHALFSENTVLQQQMDVPVWGTAADGEQVTVEIQNQKVSATTANGQWKVVLKPMEAGGPFPMKITGPTNTIEYKNVAVGEVWVCSGQSNMGSGLGDVDGGAEEIPKADHPMMRLLFVPIKRSENVEHEITEGWRIMNPYCAGMVGAVPYYFGREVLKARKVPVGIIQCVWGGSIAEAWTPKQYLEADPIFKPIFERLPRMMEQYEKQLADYHAKEPELKKQYEEAVAKAKADGSAAPAAPVPPVSPMDNGKVQRDRPYGIYNGMVAPLQPYAIRGVAWYQGESTRIDVPYLTLLSTMIRSWRETWGQGDFPFLIVQLPGYTPYATEPTESFWAEMREAQLFTNKKLPNVATTINIDLGDEKNLHPRRKEPVGARLALAARAVAYKEQVEYSGPLYEAMKIDAQKPDRVVLSFTHLGGGLVAKDGELKGFTIAGEDHKFFNAQAELQGDQVVVWSPQVAKPVAVRYAWANNPICNLWNKADLPASPFRTDEFPLVPK